MIETPGPSVQGFFVVASDTGAGKTHVAGALARTWRRAGRAVGVYKPVACGDIVPPDIAGEYGYPADRLLSQDALDLWLAAGKPGSLADVCPQTFAAPLAPPLAARQEHKRVCQKTLAAGLAAWLSSEVVIVEGAGGWFSPLADGFLASDLARQLQLPLVLVIANRVGAINQALMALTAIETTAPTLKIQSVVLSEIALGDASAETNASQLAQYCRYPVAELRFGQSELEAAQSWLPSLPNG